VTLKVSETALAVAVGVPVIAPVLVFSVSPAGSVPLVNDHVYGVVPPVAASVVEYAVPTVPLGNDEVVIDRVAGAIVRLSVADLVCAGLLESVAVKVSEVAVAVAVGVPLIRPVEPFRVSPAGSVPLVNDHV